MKTGNSIVHYKNKSDYLNRRPTASEGTKKLADATKAGELKENAADKVKNKVKDKITETKDAGKHLLSQAGGALVRSVGSSVLNTVGIGVPSVPVPDLAEVKESKTIEGKEITRINKPAIFFINGFHFNPFRDESKGLTGMAKNIPGAEVFSWSEADKVIDAVKTRPHTQPVILVGHGMGGDSAVDVVNKLNSVEHGFRRVDLLVTMDSIGTDNDVIPQNVRENYNIISDQDSLFNDGPNIARKKNQTKVDNELFEMGHNQLEEDTEVQFLVFEKINRTLMNAVNLKNLRENLKEGLNKQLNQKIMDSHRLTSKAANLSH